MAKLREIGQGGRPEAAYTDSVCTSRPIAILDDVGGNSGWYKSPVSRVNVINGNARMYPIDIYQPALDSLKKAGFPIPGENPHPKAVKAVTGKISFDSILDNQACVFREAYIDSATGIVYGEWKPLDSPKGRILKAIADEGKAVGFSNRMLGSSVKTMIDSQQVEVSTKLYLHVWDPVMNPAESNALDIPTPLTDAQLTAIMDSEAVEDSLIIGDMTCPTCSIALEPRDGDNDGDIDFYECTKCKGVFVADMSLSSTTYASADLRLVNPGNYERYDLARQYIATRQMTAAAGMTDSQNKGGMTEMPFKPEELMEALKDPAVRAAFAAVAAETAKPALDALEVQKAAAQASLQAATAKAEVKTFLDEKITTLKGKMDEKGIQAITDAVTKAEPITKEQAGTVFDAILSVMSDSTAGRLLAGVGFNGTSTGEGGHTRVEVTNEPKPWMPIVDQITKAFDEYGETFGRIPDQSLRKQNRKMVDKIMGRYEGVVGVKALADSVQGFENLSDAVSVTTAELLNQPTIITAVLIQAFQDVESLQFMMADVFGGTEWRIPVETFTSAAAVNSATGLLDLLVGEGVGIPESSISLSWLPFQPSWRRNAVSLTTDVVEALRSGPAKYEAIARAIYHIGADKGRKLDDAAYYEMLLTADEYAPKVVTNEITPANLITAGAVGTNVEFVGSLTLAGTATATAGTNPLVRPRTKMILQNNGQSAATVVNPFVVKVNGGTALVMGYLDASGNVAGTNAVYAVDWENGKVYYTEGAGLDPEASTPVLPTVSYSGVKNYDRWSTVVPEGVKAEDYYNTLLQQFSRSVALMGSSPRFKKPNIAIMSLNAATYIENAQLFYKLAQPEGTKLITTSNYFGERSNVNLAKINAPWVAGDGRMLLTQKGSTRYGVQTPYAIEGPYPKYDTNGLIIDAKLWYGKENSVLCTPQTTDVNGNVINPVSRTLKFV